MKFFIDTANTEEIKKAWELGVIDGVTTNPSLISKEAKDPVSLLKEICSIVNGPVSAEAVSMTADKMVEEADVLSKIHENIVIKIPMIEEGLKGVEFIAINTDAQALLMSDAGTPSGVDDRVASAGALIGKLTAHGRKLDEIMLRLKGLAPSNERSALVSDWSALRSEETVRELVRTVRTAS
jgi:hypothetical protein